jgi:hypothetical protein
MERSPPELRSKIVRNDELIAVYRMSRQYLPKEIAAYDLQTNEDILGRRVAHLVCAWAEGANLRSDTVRSNVATLQELMRTDGKLDGKTFKVLEGLIDGLKAESGKVPKLLIDLCTNMIELKELEATVHDREHAVMQELVKQLQQ